VTAKCLAATAIGLSSFLLAACGDDTTPPPMDSGMDAAVDTAPPDTGEPDTGVDAAPDVGACGPDCDQPGDLCCPAGLGWECVTETAEGECPTPDLTILPDRAADTARVEWAYFEADDCAIVEGCVLESGWRRLLRFDTVTPNIGTGDLHMGAPSEDNPTFVYSECHDHYHFDGYADYRLMDDGGDEVGFGHKQAFCLLDSEQYITDDPTVRRVEQYDCDDQGIQRGWADNYDASLDCQWVDVTDVAPGDYTLRIAINEMEIITELDYENNVAEVSVTVPPDMPDPDPTLACEGTETGVWRNCGFAIEGDAGRTCTPGERVGVGCGTGCMLGSCSGDTVLRVCDGSEPCGSRDSLANDDDGCGDYCSYAEFDCPASGTYTVLTGGWDPDTAVTCTVGVTTIAP
jgi:hypothetical protein